MKAALLLWESGGSSSTSIACWTPLCGADEAAVQGTYWRAGNVGPGRARESPLPMQLVPGSPAARQSRYMRLLLPAVTYYSNDRNSAPYGQQWREGVPAPDSYGVDSHPERFAGLHSAALALLEHLAGDYDVEVHGDPVHARDLLLDA